MSSIDLKSIKEAETGHEVLESISARWSPRTFAGRAVPRDSLLRLLEAARWAPSCFNEQPWHFIVGTKTEPGAGGEAQSAASRTGGDATGVHERILRCLTAKNQRWAYAAPVLLITVERTVFSKNGKTNRHALHDVGLAMGNLIQQAGAEDLYVHQMAGIDGETARLEFEIPADYEVVAGVAIGYLGDPDSLSDEFREKELAVRTRKALGEFVHSDSFGTASTLLQDED